MPKTVTEDRTGHNIYNETVNAHEHEIPLITDHFNQEKIEEIPEIFILLMRCSSQTGNQMRYLANRIC